MQFSNRSFTTTVRELQMFLHRPAASSSITRTTFSLPSLHYSSRIMADGKLFSDLIIFRKKSNRFFPNEEKEKKERKLQRLQSFADRQLLCSSGLETRAGYRISAPLYNLSVRAPFDGPLTPPYPGILKPHLPPST